MLFTKSVSASEAAVETALLSLWVKVSRIFHTSAGGGLSTVVVPEKILCNSSDVENHCYATYNMMVAEDYTVTDGCD